MNKIFTLLILCFITAMSSCGNKEVKMTVENKRILKNGDSLSFDISYPLVYVNGEYNGNVNSIIEDELKDGFFTGYLIHSDGYSLTALIDTLFEMRDETPFRERTMSYLSEWSAYQRRNVGSICFDKTYFIGGANPFDATQYLNFNLVTGEELTVEDLFTDLDSLQNVVRSAFIAEKGLSIDDSKDITGLFVDLIDLTLPNNIGFDSTGVIFLYNKYEIAPRSYGNTRISIPYEELTGIMTPLDK